MLLKKINFERKKTASPFLSMKKYSYATYTKQLFSEFGQEAAYDCYL